MRWVTYTTIENPSPRAGLLSDGNVLGAGSVSLLALLSEGNAKLAEHAERVASQPSEHLSLADVSLQPPIPTPPSVRDFMSFEEHTRNSLAAIGKEVPGIWYEQPVFYFSNPASMQSHRSAVEISPGSRWFDYELEVAAVIGLPGRDIAVDSATDHIAGLVLLCDWTARDLQGREMKVGLGPTKGKDSATSLGPWLVTLDDLQDDRLGGGYNLAMTALVNGAPYSSGNLSDLFWSFEQMVAYASRGTELASGDIIGSGTVGTGAIVELAGLHGLAQYPWLRAGDRVDLHCEKLGGIASTVHPARPVAPLGDPNRRTA